MAKHLSSKGLDQRAQYLLKILIERYLREGNPVGSRTLSRDLEQGLSPATIRNVMADLEEMGLVQSPHTSAGRIPTEHGLRFFVDSLLQIDPLDETEVSTFQQKLPPGMETTELMESASKILSDVTRLAGVVMLPRKEHRRLSHIEFVPLSERRVLVILVISDEEVQNRIISVERDYSAAELQRAGNYLTEQFVGREIEEVRQAIIDEMRDDRQTMDQMMVAAIQMADQTFRTGEREDYVVAGQTNLMDVAELADTRKLRQIFDAFNEKQQILQLLDGALTADGIKIFIGHESDYTIFKDCSVVTAPYQVEGEQVGVLGVIGPTRMAYDRVIPVVDLTAKLLGSALNQQR